jgi:hypothetical protein
MEGHVSALSSFLFTEEIWDGIKLQILLSSLVSLPYIHQNQSVGMQEGASISGLPITCNLAVGLRSTRRYHLPSLELQP